MAKPKVPTKREIEAACAAYHEACIRWGENNQITVRAHIRYYELKEARETALSPKGE